MDHLAQTEAAPGLLDSITANMIHQEAQNKAHSDGRATNWQIIVIMSNLLAHGDLLRM
jgi:hypothetical protein